MRQTNLFAEGCSTSGAATGATPPSETETIDLSPDSQLPPKMRKREGRSKRLRLTVAEALARVDRRILLDPEEDSQLEVINEEEGGPTAPPRTPESDSDI